MTMDAQPDFRYQSPESRLDFALWVASRWHGNRPRYWRADFERGVLFIDVQQWSGRRDEPILRRSLAESWLVLISSRPGWRRSVAGMIRRARSNLRRPARVDLNAHTDRRTEAGLPMRKALVRLRLAEAQVIKYMCVYTAREYTAQELSEAIEGVAALIRKREEAK